MGMYTELLVKGELRRDAPEEVRSALRSLITGEYGEDQVWPSHRFFANERFDFVATGSSSYFVTGRSVYYPEHGQFFINASLKNYTDTIEEFLDWLLPYVDAFPGAFLGFTRYEEDDAPALIYMPSQTVIDGEVVSTAPELQAAKYELGSRPD